MLDRLESTQPEQINGQRRLPNELIGPWREGYDSYQSDDEYMDDFEAHRLAKENGGCTIYSEQEWVKKFKDSRAEKLWGEIFWNMLVKYVNQTNFELPAGRPVDILDLACGGCKEGWMLNHFFSSTNPKSDGISNKVNLVGVDIDPENIKNAQYENGGQWDNELRGRKPLENMVFVVGDATKLEEYSEIPELADVVVVRHQQFVGGPDYLSSEEAKKIWTSIISGGVKRLCPGGIAIITSYFKNENEPVKELLSSFDGRIVVDEENGFARSERDKYSIQDDQNILIFEKTKE